MFKVWVNFGKTLVWKGVQWLNPSAGTAILETAGDRLRPKAELLHENAPYKRKRTIYRHNLEGAS